MEKAEIEALQRRLKYYDGAIDGDLGPKTYAALFCQAAGRNLGDIGRDMGKRAALDFPKAKIVTPLRIAHFMAQAAHETQGFLYFVEIWGPTPAQSRYDTRIDLGNTPAVDGDGKRYRGRGIFMITGARNYRLYGARISIDLYLYPERAADPAVSIDLACIFWGDLNLNAFADRDDALAVSRGVNTNGPTSHVTPVGLDDRKARLATMKEAFGL